MKTLKLHHPTGHPYWQKDEYDIELPNGEMIYPEKHIEDNYGGFRVYWDDKGVWVQICLSSSGGGKRDRQGVPPTLLVSSEDYDNIEFVGEPLTISGELSNDLAENGLI